MVGGSGLIGPRPRWGLVTWVAVLLAASGCAPDCEPDEGSAPDYADREAWFCHPSLDSDECDADLTTVEVLPDNTVVAVDRAIAEEPGFDCFYVYPTMDLSLRAQLHDDLSDDADEARVVRAQAARLAEVCEVFAPRYRQVTIGTYVGSETATEPCFDVAYDDVERAFDAWVAERAADRGVFLVGHSQGGQIVSRLLRDRFDGDPDLRARLVGAMPLGWAVGVAAGELTGGSSDEVPACTEDDEAGCIVAFRTFAEGNRAPDATGRFAEGDEEICVHPGDVSGGGPAGLAGALFLLGEGSSVELPAGLDVGDAEYVLYRDYFSGECVSDGDGGGLQISAAPASGDERAIPVDFAAAGLSGSGGTHVLDMAFTMLDLVERARAMGEGWGR